MTPQERIARWVFEQRLLEIGEVMEVAQCNNRTTPIETIFFVAIHTVCKELRWLEFVYQKPEHGQLAIEMQVPIDRYRVDYLVSVTDETGRLHQMVVECDGHDFHERTKEQAKKDRSRDRRLQELGFIVYRFTGSELYSDPVKCAFSVHEWALAKSGVR
jgi:very-short-patch-repair endonuclease